MYQTSITAIISERNIPANAPSAVHPNIWPTMSPFIVIRFVRGGGFEPTVARMKISYTRPDYMIPAVMLRNLFSYYTPELCPAYPTYSTRSRGCSLSEAFHHPHMVSLFMTASGVYRFIRFSVANIRSLFLISKFSCDQ